MPAAKKAAAKKTAPAAKKSPGRPAGSKNKPTAAAQAASAPPTTAAPVASSLTPEQSQALYVLEQTRQYIRENCQPHIQEELRLRKLLMAQLMPQPVEGTHYIELGNGYRLRMRQGFKRKLDRDQFPAVFSQPGMEGTAERLLNWKAELFIQAYRELTPEQKAVFDQCVTTDPEAPVLEVLAPGQKDDNTDEG